MHPINVKCTQTTLNAPEQLEMHPTNLKCTLPPKKGALYQNDRSFPTKKRLLSTDKRRFFE